MGKIKGITVQLHIKTSTTVDDFGAPILVDSIVDVDDVLVEPITAEDSANILALYGKHAAYTLAIPKGDNHTWEDTEIEFFGQKFRTFGFAVEGIEENIPLRWNKKIKVERYG